MKKSIGKYANALGYELALIEKTKEKKPKVVQKGGIDLDKKNLLADDVTKIVIYDEKNKKEIAVITEEAVTTADDTIVVKVSFD